MVISCNRFENAASNSSSSEPTSSICTGKQSTSSSSVATGPREVRVLVGGTSRLARVELVRHTASTGWTTPRLVEPDDDRLELSWTEEDPGESAVYYLRVVQEDGHFAWSSPVWVDP